MSTNPVMVTSARGPIPNKVPGEPIQSTQDEPLILERKSVVQLRELLERQNKLLLNKSLVSKLRDGGAKISNLRDRILEEIEKRSSDHNLCSSLEKLDINDPNYMEWKSPAPDAKIPSESHVEQTLKIIANHSGTIKYFGDQRVEKIDGKHPVKKSSFCTNKPVKNFVQTLAKELPLRESVRVYRDQYDNRKRLEICRTVEKLSLAASNLARKSRRDSDSSNDEDAFDGSYKNDEENEELDDGEPEGSGLMICYTIDEQS